MSNESAICVTCGEYIEDCRCTPCRFCKEKDYEIEHLKEENKLLAETVGTEAKEIERLKEIIKKNNIVKIDYLVYGKG